MTPAVRHYTVLFRKENPSRPILECYHDARRHAHFMDTMHRDAKAHKARSVAAKRGWKNRRKVAA